jgi:hypothetical protein
MHFKSLETLILIFNLNLSILKIKKIYLDFLTLVLENIVLSLLLSQNMYIISSKREEGIGCLGINLDTRMSTL